jgi:hypothetical protein
VPVAEPAPLDVATGSEMALATGTTDTAVMADAALMSGNPIGDEGTSTVAGALPERWEGPDAAMVLACDGDVRARLEFLMWVRRMTGDAPARPPAWQLADAGVPV